ncbi:MAG: S41 family peptidase [Flavobacteriaceae bacterium]|nr:S41 family peptidase [Flavobacteriaceae bacterium]
MYNRFIKTLCLGFIFLLTFVSCNDYQEQIDELESQISNISVQSLRDKIAQLETEIKTLRDSEDISKLQIEIDELKRQLGLVVHVEADLEKPEYEISDFIWRAMNFFYFWQDDVNLLANTRYDDRNQYIQMIKENSDPEKFFDRLLYEKGEKYGDRFSWFIDDYIEQEKDFQGVSKDHGMQWRPSRTTNNSNDLFGYVQLVHAGSNAEEQEVKRGMLFTKVDNQPLTLNNYREYWLGDVDSFTIHLAKAEFNDAGSFTGFVETGQTITLTAQEDFARDPIIVNKVIEKGNHKIGYLFYNQFVYNNTRHIQLNDVFDEFKSEGITDLIVDLRYNRGGSSATSDFIASAISGKGENDIISKSFWNPNFLNTLYGGADALIEYFPDDVPLRGSETSVMINKLDLERVFFITSRFSASASEQLINNLDPYMEVIQVGETTVGKNDGSFTLYDIEEVDPRWYTSRNNGAVNPNHNNAIQPLVVKSGNAEEFYEFESGLVPDYEIIERVLDLGTIGDASERLLARVLEVIAPSGNRYLDANHYDVEFEVMELPEDQTGFLIYELETLFPTQE